MTTSQPRIKVTGQWLDITVANPALASVDVFIQNLDDEETDVVFGGATEPEREIGAVRLDLLDSIERVNAANIWVRGGGFISVTVL